MNGRAITGSATIAYDHALAHHPAERGGRIARKVNTMKLMKAALVAALAAGVGTTSALAAEEKPRRNDEPGAPRIQGPAGLPQRTLSLEGVQAASVGDARVAIVYDAIGRAILRQKRVARVRLPAGSTGLYCIRPANMSNFTVRNLVPQVTVEYSNSIADLNGAYFAYYRQNGCWQSEIGVQTARMLDNGDVVPSDNVSFAMVAD